MKKTFVPLLLILVISFGCSNADPKKMAESLCDCVQSKKKISSEAKKIVLKASKTDDFQTSYQESLLAIEDETKRQEVQSEVSDMMEAFQSKKTRECAEEIDKKYKVYKSDEKETQQKLVEEMENVDGCEIYAAVVKAGLKKQGKLKDDGETTKTDDEEDNPKKKKTTEEEE